MSGRKEKQARVISIKARRDQAEFERLLNERRSEIEAQMWERTVTRYSRRRRAMGWFGLGLVLAAILTALWGALT